MAFTYNLATPDDITRVRFAIGDTVADAAMFQDDELTFVISENGNDWRRAVIACIRNIITRLNAEPDTQADWLRLDWRRSLDGWLAMLREKQDEFGLPPYTVTGTAQATYRADSLQTKVPDGWS